MFGLCRRALRVLFAKEHLLYLGCRIQRFRNFRVEGSACCNLLLVCIGIAIKEECWFRCRNSFLLWFVKEGCCLWGLIIVF